MNFRRQRQSRRNSLNIVTGADKWKYYGRSVSRREIDYIDDSSDDEIRIADINNWEEDFLGKKRLSSSQSDQDTEVLLSKKQTYILATLVPDEILHMDKFDTSEPKKFVGVLLMADVSGYTALSERYNSTGKTGTYRLTATLNTYIGSLLEIIYGHGGDVIKFAGDAFLALWKTDKRTFISHTIHQVITCALIIQHSYATYETDVKVNLKVKLAISAGNLIFAPIGVGIDMNYVIYGLPVIEAKLAESQCASGEVKLTPSAWGHCYSRNYDYVLHENGHVTIKCILYDPREKDVTKPFHGFGSLVKPRNKTFNAIENLPSCYWYSPDKLTTLDLLKMNESLTLRKVILSAESKNLGSEIRKFMVRPVLTQIDAHQPLEYLTEMRQVSILFITLKPKACPFLHLLTIVNNSYQITTEIVYKLMGCVNKIILFDKDVMILVIFGLRGFKHESEAQAALKCAYSIRKSVSALDGVLEVSIGVTTGQVYCGVVGHPLRREFTVIGAIVNKAARLMCSFRNKITCDESTFVKSKMSSNSFTLQPRTELKGINDPGKIYEYTEEIRVKELFGIPIITPLLNRSDELAYFDEWLGDSTKTIRSFDAILLVGETRIGKTKLLEWMCRHARQSGFKVCHLNLTSIHSSNAYLAMCQIIDKILDLKEPIVGFLKEEKIVQMLKEYDEDLCYLNNVIKVRFAYHEGIKSQNEEERERRAMRIFSKLISCILETYVICLDDLHNLDPSSWKYLSLMFACQKIFCVFTVTRGKYSAAHSWLYNVFMNNNVRKIVLGPLSSSWIPPLACQILNVDAVPQDLCKALKIYCKGMPGLVESFLVHLFSIGALDVQEFSHDDLEEVQNEELEFPDPALLQPQALDSKKQSELNQQLQEEETKSISICVVTQKEELTTDMNDQNVDALIMIQIDSLTPYQQLLLKIASVIGNVFSRELLENIMYENNPLTTAKAIKRLFAMRILACANAKRKSHKSSSLQSNNSKHSIQCDCSFSYDDEDPENTNLPKYAFCKIMKFKNKNSRQTCYELLPMNQKKEFHSRIVNYLENNKQKCPECGGKIMVVSSSLNNQEEPNVSLNDDVMFSSVNTSTNNSFDEDLDSFSDASQPPDTELAKNQSQCFLPRNTKSLLSVCKSETAFKKYSILKPKYSEDYIKSAKRVTVQGSDYKKNLQSINDDSELNSEENIKLFNKLRAVTEAETIDDWNNLGVYCDSQDDLPESKGNHDLSYYVKLEKGTSKTNFFRCTCGELRIIIFEQLIYHAKQAELFLQAIEFLIEYSYLNILVSIYDVALASLSEAEDLCTHSAESMHKFDRKRFRAKIYTLRASALARSGFLNPAKLELERATRLYKINLFNVSNFLKIKNIFKTVKIRRSKNRNNKLIMAADSLLCLNLATMIFSMLGEDKVARLSAMRAIEIVEKVDCENNYVCECLSNALRIEISRGAPELTADIERKAKNILKNLDRPFLPEELFTLGKLFVASFTARIARGVLSKAERAGLKSFVLSKFLQADSVTLEIVPDLFYVFVARKRFSEAVELAQEILHLGLNRHGLDCETWYYAFCIDFILDAGFQIEKPNEISRFAEYALLENYDYTPGKQRLLTSLWTYWLRSDNDKRAKRFEKVVLTLVDQNNNDGTLKSIITSLRLAEGMILSLERKVEDLRKVVDLMELRSLADKELNKVERDSRLCKTVYPRWLLTKGKSYQLYGRQQMANACFLQALEEARKTKNYLEEAMAMAVTGNSDYWKESATAGSFLDWKIGLERAQSSWHLLL